MNLTCSIIDSNNNSLCIIKQYIEKTENLKILPLPVDYLSAISEMPSEMAPNLIFFNVDNLKMDIEYISRCMEYSEVVIISSGTKYAIQSYEFDVFDYLLTPISYHRFLLCINKAKSQLFQNGNAAIKTTSILVKTGIRGQLFNIQTADIIFIEAASNYIIVHFENEKIMTYLSIREILKGLPFSSFSRIHTSFIINHRRLKIVEHGQVTLDNKTKLPIGRAFRKEFRSKLNILC